MNQAARDEEVQHALHQQRELHAFAERKGLWVQQAHEDLLNRAAFKRQDKRFDGRGPTDFGALMELPA